MIDRKLQKECYKKAIKRTAENNNLTQKHVKEIVTKKYSLNNDMLPIQNSVENWTVEYYNREMQKRYLKDT